MRDIKGRGRRGGKKGQSKEGHKGRGRRGEKKGQSLRLMRVSVMSAQKSEKTTKTDPSPLPYYH